MRDAFGISRDEVIHTVSKDVGVNNWRTKNGLKPRNAITGRVSKAGVANGLKLASLGSKAMVPKAATPIGPRAMTAIAGKNVGAKAHSAASGLAWGAKFKPNPAGQAGPIKRVLASQSRRP